MKKRITAIIICIVAIAVIVAIIVTQSKENAVNVIQQAGVMPGCTEQQLILNSDIIVEATVTEIGKSFWHIPTNPEQQRNVLQTDITFDINELLSGEYTASSVVVRVNKGFHGETNTRVISDGYPDFYVGEHVVLFLSRDDSSIATDEDYFVLTYMRQGKWIVSPDNGSLVADMTHVTHETDLCEDSIESLKQRIAEEKSNNPDWDEIRAAQREETKKNNALLFGE